MLTKQVHNSNYHGPAYSVLRCPYAKRHLFVRSVQQAQKFAPGVSDYRGGYTQFRTTAFHA